MIRILTTWLLLCHFIITYSQEKIFEKVIALKKDTETFQVYNEENGALAVFLISGDEIKSFLFDGDRKFSGELTGSRPAARFRTFLGGNISNGSINLYFVTELCKEVAVVTFDYQSNKVTTTTMRLPAKNEVYLSSFNYGNRVYILTIPSHSSIINMYVISDPTRSEVKSFDFTDYQFSKNDTKLSGVVGGYNTVFVKNDLPIPIKLAGERHKAYCHDDKVWITLDGKFYETAVIIIDLLTYDSYFKTYKQPLLVCGISNATRWNSYVHNGKLYQLSVCSEEIKVKITDVKTDVLLNQLSALEKDSIRFKNSDLMSVNLDKVGAIPTKVERTDRFLSRLVHSTGISVFQTSHYLELTIGGISISGGAPMPSGMGSTPTITTAYYFKCLLDPYTYKHVDGIKAIDPFDKINEFVSQVDAKMMKVIFRAGDNYMLGYYSKKRETYYLVEFKE